MNCLEKYIQLRNSFSTDKLHAGYGKSEGSNRSVSKGKRRKLNKKEKELKAKQQDEIDANLRLQNYAFKIKPRQEESAAKG